MQHPPSTAAIGTILLGMVAAAPAANIAGSGTPISGVHNTIDSTLGTPFVHVGQNINLLNDGDPATRIDTWNADAEVGGGGVSYMGVTGLTIPDGEEIFSVSMTLATFLDGGWFGTNGVGPGAGGALQTGTHLTVPTLQATSDGGTTWLEITTTGNNYLAVMDGHTIGGGGNPNPTFATVDFPLDSPLTAIDGIRLIGTEGGLAGGDTTGFVGAGEFFVDTRAIPEPSHLAIIAAAGLALAIRRRR